MGLFLSSEKRELIKKERKEQETINKERIKHHKDVLKKAKLSEFEEKQCSSDAYISLQHVDKIYPNHVQAVYDFNLDIAKNEFIVFLGPSGCGKSTTLRMIAGLEEITCGDLFIDGVYSNELPSKDRKIGMVFQSYALYPHMSVYENMAFGLRVQHVNKDEIHDRIKAASKILQIEEYLDRKPSALSGGQCQRVALGRAIVTDSKVFLMDEPLSNLDAKLRVAMRSEIVKLHNTLGTTTIYVTHDQTEAMTMATRIVVMNKGRVQQIGTPDEIFNNPSNLFVATFIGSPAMNLLKVQCKDNLLTLENGTTLSLDNSLKEKVKEFYSNEITSTTKEINDWKDEYLRREVETRKYKKVVSNDVINPVALIKYVSTLDEEILTSLNINKENLLSVVDITQLNNVLREYLFETERRANPEIASLVKRLEDLVNLSKQDTKELILGIRPEHIIEDTTSDSFTANINLVELLGSEYYVHLDFLEDKEILVKVEADKKLYANEKLSVAFKKQFVHIFDPITSKTIF